MVWEAYKVVRKGGKTGGVDGIGMLDYERNVKNNLYKLWNRQTSGSYFPRAVKRGEILKHQIFT